MLGNVFSVSILVGTIGCKPVCSDPFSRLILVICTWADSFYYDALSPARILDKANRSSPCASPGILLFPSSSSRNDQHRTRSSHGCMGTMPSSRSLFAYFAFACKMFRLWICSVLPARTLADSMRIIRRPPPCLPVLNIQRQDRAKMSKRCHRARF